MVVQAPRSERGGPQPALALSSSFLEKQSGRLPVFRLCVISSPRQTSFFPQEAFQINVFSSLKTFWQIFCSGEGRVSSGNGQAHVGTEWCEKDFLREEKEEEKNRKEKKSLATPPPPPSL